MGTELESYKAKVIDLAGFIEYSNDSVVSKTLVDKKRGTNYSFFVRCGARVERTYRMYDAVVHVVDGEAEIIIVALHRTSQLAR